jgi:N-methylhydantoinase A
MSLVSRYLRSLQQNLEEAGCEVPVYLMNSDGNVSTASQAAKLPIAIIESGPAAGVLACADLARALSLRRAATFDMGGTTAKTGMVTDYEPDISYEFEASGATHSGRPIKGSGYPVRHPFIDLAEVSAGGGTIAWVDEGGALRLGPTSAGAEPGPACYGRGGVEPTITDANVVLGRLSPKHLLGGGMDIHPELAERAISGKIASKLGVDTTGAAKDIIRVVNHNMARAISIVSVERGRDPRDYALIAFGGAGPLHACDLAEEMSISEIVVPPHPGLFSAYGLLTVDLARVFSKPVMSTDLEALKNVFEKLKEESKTAVSRETREVYRHAIRKREWQGGRGRPKDDQAPLDDGIQILEYVDLRYQGQSFEITLPYSSPSTLRGLFDEKHAQLYGYSSPEARVEAVNAKVKIIIPVPKIERKAKVAKSYSYQLEPTETRNAWISGAEAKTPVYSREQIRPGAVGYGPCIIEEYDSTTVVNSSWNCKMDGLRNLRLARQNAKRGPHERLLQAMR